MPIQRPRPVLLGVWVAFVLHLTTAACFAQAPSAPQKPLPKQPGKTRFWTTHWSFQGVDVKRLFSRLESIGLTIPVDAVGDVSVEFDVSVPWTSLRDGKAYRIKGNIKSKRLRLEDLLLEDFDAKVNYVDGVLHLDDVNGRWSDAARTQRGGSFKGSAQAELLPRGSFQADIHAEKLPFGPLHDLLVSQNRKSDVRPIRGTVSGDIHFKAPIDRLRNVATWTADTNLEIDSFQIDDSLVLSARTGRIQIRDGVIQAEQIEVTSPTSPDVQLDLAIQAELTGQQRFQFHIRGNDIPLASLTEMVVPEGHLAAGKLDLDAQGEGDLASESWDVQGRLGSPKLTILGLNLGLLEHQFTFDQHRLELRAIDPDAGDHETAMLVKQVAAAYTLNKQSLQVSDIAARLFDGTFEGQATLSRTAELSHQAKFSWRDLDLEFNVAPLLPARVKLSATTSGTVDWSLQPGALGSPTAHRGTAHIRLDQISLGKASVGDMQVGLQVANGAVNLVGEGKLFGGTFQVDTRSELEANDTWSTILEAPLGQAKAERMKLELIARALQPKSLRRWSGTVAIRLDRRQTEADSPAELRPTVQIIAQDVFVEGRSVSRRLEMHLRLKGDVIIVDRVSGSYAGGNLWARGSWSLGRGTRQIRCRLARIDAGDALLPISDRAASRVNGKVSGTITLSGDESLRFSGGITAHHSAFFSVPTGTVHGGIRGSISPDLSRWKVALTSIQGELAEGRITADAQFSSSSARGGFDLSSRWEVSRVNFGELLAATGSSSTIADGRMTGKLSLSGRGIRSSSDLVGRFDARLGATQAAAVPGLVQADQFLGFMSLAGVQFTEGHIDGVIASGAASIDEFWLRGGRVNVWSDGKIQLANRRVDLNVVVSTGYLNSGNRRLLSLASQLAVQSVLPIAALVEVNRLLSHRTVHLGFSGPLSDPRIRLKPMEIIREEAARFLLRELLIATSASANWL